MPASILRNRSVQYACKSMSEKLTFMQPSKNSHCCFYTFCVLSRLCSPSSSLQGMAPEAQSESSSPISGWSRWERVSDPQGGWVAWGPRAFLMHHCLQNLLSALVKLNGFSCPDGAAAKSLLLKTMSCYTNAIAKRRHTQIILPLYSHTHSCPRNANT